MNDSRLPQASRMGRSGGLARARSLSPERRTEIARRAAQTRWANPNPSERPRDQNSALPVKTIPVEKWVVVLAMRIARRYVLTTVPGQYGEAVYYISKQIQAAHQKHIPSTREMSPDKS